MFNGLFQARSCLRKYVELRYGNTKVEEFLPLLICKQEFNSIFCKSLHIHMHQSPHTHVNQATHERKHSQKHIKR